MATKAKPAKKSSGPVVEVAEMSAPSAERERKWRAEDALRTLSEAERIKQDKSLMGDVEKARKAKIKDLESICVETSPRTIGKR
jgi:hypothetical protein